MLVQHPLEPLRRRRPLYHPARGVAANNLSGRAIPFDEDQTPAKAGVRVFLSLDESVESLIGPDEIDTWERREMTQSVGKYAWVITSAGSRMPPRVTREPN